MHREDDSNYLLYIEPRKEEKLDIPIHDEWSKLVDYALSKSQFGAARYDDLTDTGHISLGNSYRGIHRTECGMYSSCRDYLLENGMITNSLCIFYLQWYRNSIPTSEWKKLNKLYEFYKISLNGNQTL